MDKDNFDFALFGDSLIRYQIILAFFSGLAKF